MPAIDAVELIVEMAQGGLRPAMVVFLDDAGEPHFLEINPLPTFAPDGSFGIAAELAGRPLPELLADVLRAGLERLGFVQ